jgi:hypothetical protein
MHVKNILRSIVHVLDICDAIDANERTILSCIRTYGVVCRSTCSITSYCINNPHEFTQNNFARFFLDGSPVFPGDKLYLQCGTEVVVSANAEGQDGSIVGLSWIKPNLYKDFVRGEPVITHDGHKRYFYGVNLEGKPICYKEGKDGWVSSVSAATSWNSVRKLTTEEQAERRRVVFTW